MSSAKSKDLTLRQKALKGVVWVGIVTIGAKLLGVLTTLFLARILSPDDYGLIGIATIVMAALTIFTDLGLGSAIIHSKRDRQTVASTAFFIMPAVGFALFTIAFLTAPLLASLLGNPSAVGIIQIFSVNLLLSSFAVVPSALMEKDMAYRRKAIPDLVPFLVYASVALTLASTYNMGAYSIAYALLAQGAAAVILTWLVSGWRPSRVFDRSVAAELFGYGKHVLGGSGIFYLATNMDNIFVSRVAGQAALGYYTLSYSIANLPATHVADVLGRVLFPSFVTLNQDPVRLRSVYVRSVRLVVLITYPLLAGLAVIAYPFTVVVLGEKWAPMAPALAILSVFTAARVLSGATGSLLLAIGRPKVIFVTGIVGLTLQAILLTLFVVYLQLGFVGAAIAVSAASLLNGFLIFFYVHSIMKFRLWPVILQGVRYIAPTLIMSGLVYAVQQNLPIDIWGLLASVSTGIILYPVLILLFNGTKPFTEILHLIRKRDIKPSSP